MGRGWDDDLWRLGRELAVRLPRRPDAAHLVVREHRWLTSLAPRLPLAVPAPLRLDAPGLGLHLALDRRSLPAGEVAARTAPASPEVSARALAAFVAALHVPASIDADAVLCAWEAARAAPGCSGPAMWLHGDLHPGNLLVLDGRLLGVIDFGALTAGDPATDLAVAWMLLPPRERQPFRALYAGTARHGLDDATWSRARGWSAAMALAFVGHGAENAMMAGLGARTLAEVIDRQ